MQNKCGLQLDQVVLLGRTFEEYRRYFLLEPQKLIGKRVLDVRFPEAYWPNKSACAPVGAFKPSLR